MLQIAQGSAQGQFRHTAKQKTAKNTQAKVLHSDIKNNEKSNFYALGASLSAGMGPLLSKAMVQ